VNHEWSIGDRVRVTFPPGNQFDGIIVEELELGFNVSASTFMIDSPAWRAKHEGLLHASTQWMTWLPTGLDLMLELI